MTDSTSTQASKTGLERTETHKVLLLDAFIEQAVAQWRAWRVEHPWRGGDISEEDHYAMNGITDGIVPTDRVTLLTLAADDRVWLGSESPASGVTIGQCLEVGVRWALRRAMWATDGVS